jgi:phosphonate transport system substrate-binding protein
MNRFYAASFTLLVPLVALMGCGRSLPPVDADPETLKVALLPDESPSTVIANNSKLKEYLERELGKNIELVVTTDYSSMIEAIRHGRIHLGYFGPLSYVLARQKSEIEPFAALKSKGSTTYRAVLIVHSAAGIDSVDQLRGKDIAFGDQASTGSHLIPRAMLAEHGMLADADYKPQYVGAHDRVALTVQSGVAQGGGLSRPIFDSLVERGIIDPKKVKVLEESKPYPNYPWTMRSDLSSELKEKSDPEVLKPFKAEGFGPVTDADYDPIRSLGKLLNLDLSKF